MSSPRQSAISTGPSLFSSPQLNPHDGTVAERIRSGDAIILPARLWEVFREVTKESPEQPSPKAPWLHELTKFENPDLRLVRQAFLTDGHTVMSALRNYISIVVWSEFIYECLFAVRDGRTFFELMNSDFNLHDDVSDCGPDRVLRMKTDFSGLHEECFAEFPHLWETLKSRNMGKSCNPHLENVYLSKEAIVAKLAKKLHRRFEDIKESLMQIQTWAKLLKVLRVGSLTFGYNVEGLEQEPAPLIDSSQLKTIGRNLCSLGQLVGADVPRYREETKPVTLVTALENTIQIKGAIVNIMLARIEEQGATIRKQQQVITALQFRHLLEHLPRHLQIREIDAAGDATAKAQAAARWNKVKAAERWLAFWDEAVQQVYDVYMEHGRADWTPSEDKRPSPLAALLSPYLPQAPTADGSSPVVWLARQTSVGHHAQKLYGTLSELIHRFSDGNFAVDPLNFSPGDYQILKALVPAKFKDEKTDGPEAAGADAAEDDAGIVTKEFRRYIWSAPRKIALTQPETGMEIVSEDIMASVQHSWRSLQSKPPFSRLVSDQLADFSAGISETNKTKKGEVAGPSPDGIWIKATLTPAATSIGSDNYLHGAVVAALVDLIDQMSIAASDLLGPRDTCQCFEVRVHNNSTVQPGEKIELQGKASFPKSRKDTLRRSTNVELKTSGGGTIADGLLKVWHAIPATRAG